MLGSPIAKTMVAVAIVLAAGTIVGGSDAARAASEDAVTWSVAPAGPEEADGRAWVEQTLDPGESRTEHLAVRNFGDSEVTFTLSAADGYFTDTGRFNMLPSSTPSTASGLWIDIDDAVTVEPGGTEVVPFTVTVPASAVPGDYAAGVAASIRSVGSEGSAAVGVESRVGFRVLTRVAGELHPALVVSDVRADYQQSWNPLEPGRMRVTFVVENTGNSRVAVSGEVAAGTGSAEFSGGDATAEYLPGDAREITVDIEGVWPTFVVPTQVIPEVMVADAGGDWIPAPDVAETVGVSAWAMPIAPLLVLLGLGLIVVAVVGGRRRRKGAMTAMVERAREEGRREARQTAS